MLNALGNQSNSSAGYEALGLRTSKMLGMALLLSLQVRYTSSVLLIPQKIRKNLPCCLPPQPLKETLCIMMLSGWVTSLIEVEMSLGNGLDSIVVWNFYAKMYRAGWAGWSCWFCYCSKGRMCGHMTPWYFSKIYFIVQCYLPIMHLWSSLGHSVVCLIRYMFCHRRNAYKMFLQLSMGCSVSVFQNQK